MSALCCFDFFFFWHYHLTKKVKLKLYIHYEIVAIVVFCGYIQHILIYQDF